MLRDIDCLKDDIADMYAVDSAWRARIVEEESALWAANAVPEGNWFRRRAETWRLARLKVRSPSHEEVFSVLDELCDCYLNGTPEERAQIRELFDRNVLWRSLTSYSGSASDQITSAEDVIWLRRGLAALSIADNRLDFRDVFVAIRELYLASARAGIDPKPFLQETAAISSTTVPTDLRHWSAHDQFMNFEKTEFFKLDVEPELVR